MFDNFQLCFFCQKDSFALKALRVLLVKWPDMSKPTFFGQFLFVCIIRSSYQVGVPGNKTWDLRPKTVLWRAILDLGPRQKEEF